MNKRRYDNLCAQLAGLDEMLTMVPGDAVIDRMSLESRRQAVAKQLDAYPVPARWPTTVLLIFNGKPVAAGWGIAADFGNRAVKEFADTVASVGASLRGMLNAKGPIPNRENYSLLITGTATGSFGFELEEDVERSRHAPGESPVESAIEQVNAILKSLSGSDEFFAETIGETHPRALGNLRSFLKIMADNEATCTLAFKEDVFRFKDVGEVRRGLSRLDPENIREEWDDLSGWFQGYLPEKREAEFKIDETGDVIIGKVNMPRRDADAINEILRRPARLTTRVRRVGDGRPRYTITGYTIVPSPTD